MVMAQSLFKVIKQKNPETVIDVLASPWSAGLLSCMPEVRNCIDMPIGHGELALMKRYKLGKSLRGKYSQAIVLPNSLKSALVPFWAKIPILTGYIGEQRWLFMNDTRRLDKKLLPMTVQRFVSLAESSCARSNYNPNTNKYRAPKIDFPIPELVITSEQVANTLSKLELLKPEQPLLVIAPGAEYGAAKRWPANYFAEVIENRVADGCQVWLIGSDKDAPITQQITKSLGDQTIKNCLDFAGKTNLIDALALLSLADQVISNDSGLMHVAAALGRKVLVIYGSSDPGFTPPLSDNAEVMQLDLECSPCFKRTCPYGHTKCLTDLTPDMILGRLTS